MWQYASCEEQEECKHEVCHCANKYGVYDGVECHCLKKFSPDRSLFCFCLFLHLFLAVSCHEVVEMNDEIIWQVAFQ